MNQNWLKIGYGSKSWLSHENGAEPSVQPHVEVACMNQAFFSHSWRLVLPILAVHAAPLNLRLEEVGSSPATYQQALWWGAAHPDVTGCFSGNKTFERCCVNWVDDTIPSGCWEDVSAYDSCCVAKADWAPRSFSCNDHGLYWQRLRQTLSLFRVFTELRETPLDRASPRECIIGGVLASILSLVHVGHYKGSRSQAQKEMDYDRAEDLLLVLFNSPVTLEEILVSGWPLFISLDLFRFDEAFQEMARQRLPLQALDAHTLRWSDSFVEVIQRGQGSRIRTDTLVKLVPLGPTVRQFLDFLGQGTASQCPETSALRIWCLS